VYSINLPTNSIFLMTLALRMAVTAGFVVSASIITERAGPVIGALVATLPVSAGPRARWRACRSTLRRCC